MESELTALALMELVLRAWARTESELTALARTESVQGARTFFYTTNISTDT
jgi:hypothetical protein